MKGTLKKLWSEESGQGMAEYGLILALIAVVCAAALSPLGTAIKLKLDEVAGHM